MAEASTKQVLFELNVDVSKSIEQMAKYQVEIQNVTAAIAEYRDIQKSGEELTEAERQEVIRLTEVKKALQKEYANQSRQVQNAITAEGKYKDTLKGLCAELSVAKDELRAMSRQDPKWEEKAAEVDALNTKVKELEASYGVYSRNVGNYENSISKVISTFGSMGGAASSVISPIKNVTAGLKALSATPVIAILGLLCTIIQQVIKSLKSSEAATHAVTEALGIFRGAGDALVKVMELLATGFSKAVEWLTKMADRLGLVSEKMKEQQELAKAEIALQKEQRENIYKNADAENEIAELRAKAAEKTKYSAEERLAFLKEASAIEQDTADRSYEAAKKAWEIIKRSNELTSSGTKDLDAEAQAYEKMMQTQTAAANMQRRLAAAITSAEKEITTERKAAAAAAQKAADEVVKAKEEERKAAVAAAQKAYAAEKSLLKLELQLTEDGSADRLALTKALLEMETAEQVQKAEQDIEDENIRAATILALREKLAADIAAAEESQAAVSQRKQVEAIMASIEEVYANDSRRFSAELTDKLEVEIEQTRAVIEAKRALGEDALEEQSELAEKEAQLQQEVYERDLALAWDNTKEQYRVETEYIEQQLELENLSMQERAALEQRLVEITAECTQQKIAALENYSSQVMSVASSVSTVLNNLASARTSKLEAEYDKQVDALDAKLEAGLISQTQYDKQVEALEEELNEKTAEIERQEAIRQKAYSAMEIVINTAAAIMKIWAEVPKFDFGASTIALTALAAAAGAAQLAAVISEPLPTAGSGGLIQGATHEQGGVLVNTENDERIIAADPSKAYPELLNLISYIGKHGSVPETGYSIPSASYSTVGAGASGSGVDEDSLADKIGKAVSSMPVYVSVKDINDGQKKYARIQQSAKL